MTQTRQTPPPATCVIPRISAKSIVFQKPVLNILILCNLIVGWGELVIKEGPGIFHQSYRFRGGVENWGE